MPARAPTAAEHYEAAALTVIYVLANTFPYLTADDVRKYIGPPPNKHVTGAAFSKARGDGLIRTTGQYVPSKVKTRNYAPIQVWASTKLTGEDHA